MSWSAELAVCGAMLLSKKAIEIASLRDEDFGFPEIAELYAKIRRLHDDGKEVTIVSVAHAYPVELREGAKCLALDACDHCVQSSQITSYLQVVKSEAYMRRFRDWHHDLADCKSPEEVEKCMADKPVQEVGGELIGIAELSLPTSEDGVTTGFSSIDSLTYGAGFVSGQTSVVSAYHKKGKTAFMTQCAIAAAKAGVPVVYATFADLSPKKLLQRTLTQESGSRQVDSDYVQAAFDDLQGLPVSFYDARKHGRHVEDFTSKLRSYAFKNEVGIIFCDYAQKIRARKLSGVEEATECSSQLVDLADDLNIPVVVGSQVTINNGDTMTKGGRVWEEDAGMVIRLDRKKDSDEAKVEIPYNRHGPEGYLKMTWNERKLIFEEDPAACMK